MSTKSLRTDRASWRRRHHQGQSTSRPTLGACSVSTNCVLLPTCSTLCSTLLISTVLLHLHMRTVIAHFHPVDNRCALHMLSPLALCSAALQFCYTRKRRRLPRVFCINLKTHAWPGPALGDAAAKLLAATGHAGRQLGGAWAEASKTKKEMKNVVTSLHATRTAPAALRHGTCAAGYRCCTPHSDWTLSGLLETCNLERFDPGLPRTTARM